MSRRGWLLFAALSLFWGIPYLFIRVAVTEIDPLLLAFGRTFLGALLLLPFALRQGALRSLLKHWRWILLYTGIEIIIPWFMLGHAETRLNSSTTGLFIAVVPLIAAIILGRLGHDRFDARRITGLLLGFAGAALLVGLDVHIDDLVSVGALALVTIGYAVGPIIISRKLSDLPPLGVITASLILSALVYAPFTPLVWPDRMVSAQAIGSVVVLAVVCTAGAFLVMFALIAEVGPSRMTFITYLNPAIAIILGALVLQEPFTIGLAIGFPLVIIGSILGTWKSKVPPPEAAGTGPELEDEPSPSVKPPS